MSYKIRWFSQASKSIKKLTIQKSERILKKLDDVKEEPFRFLEHYEGDGCYKLRIGDFRALIDIDFKKKILWVRVIDKRGRIYKK